MTSARILKDSINPAGQRIITFLLRYPRMIHAELMTHRVFSRNAASSRAIPIKKMMDAVVDDPVLPVFWGKNQSGMQSLEALDGPASAAAEHQWLMLRDDAVNACFNLSEIGVHKQWANRVLEPWMHIEVLVTSTEWGNFFNLRAHPAAMPDFQQLAFQMLDAYMKSTPSELAWGEWHIGYDFPQTGEEGLSMVDRIKVATARAARLSYMNFDGTVNVEKDKGLTDTLASNGHWSPMEHCAVAQHPTPPEVTCRIMDIPEELRPVILKNCKLDQGNFVGWTPYRKHFPTENLKEFNPQALMDRKPDWVKLESHSTVAQG